MGPASGSRWNQRSRRGFHFTQHQGCPVLYHEGQEGVVSRLSPRAVIYRKHPSFNPPSGGLRVSSLPFLTQQELKALEAEWPGCLKFLEDWGVWTKTWPGDFPGGATVRNPTANAGDTGSSPGPGRSHMPQSNWARVPQLLSLALKPASHSYWACAPQLLKPTRLETALRNKRSHCNEKPAHHNKE